MTIPFKGRSLLCFALSAKHKINFFLCVLCASAVNLFCLLPFPFFFLDIESGLFNSCASELEIYLDDF